VNKKNQMMILGGVGVVAILGLVAFLLLRPKGDDTSGGGTPTPTVGSTGSGGAPGTVVAPGNVGGQVADGQTPTGPAPGGPSAGGNDPFKNGPGAKGGVAAGRPGAPPQQIVRHQPRFDPFYVTWRVTPPPPYVFNEVEPIRLASPEVFIPPSQPFEVREEPGLRVSGIMSGDGVYAILEQGGGQIDIVKPGSSVDINVGQTKRTYRVVSISEDRVKLRSKEGNYIFMQDVPLSDVPPGTQAGGLGGYPGYSGGPGMIPGAGGLPGSGGRGGPGGYPGYPGGPGGRGRRLPGGGGNAPGIE
jgi:hypothetical protein